MPQSSSFSGERSVLWGCVLPSNTLCIDHITQAIRQQVSLQYASHTSFAHGILVSYDTLSALSN